ncbi:MAG TPA: aminomethyl-transferring glycine dehydrogenase subunit GcvPB, partial [Stellaceae bacterium]|nr:aminomethyl-transferring glycine dehydrogenase subunit GcvPB [Stellaceae bacterium]
MTGWSQALSEARGQITGRHPAATDIPTLTGNRGLQIEETLIFEQDSPGHCGVDLPEPAPHRARLGGIERRGPIGLP